MMLVLHKDFTMIKEKLDNECSENQAYKLKRNIALSHHALHDCTDENFAQGINDTKYWLQN